MDHSSRIHVLSAAAMTCCSYSIILVFTVFLHVTLQPKSALGRLTVKVNRSDTIKHRQPADLLWTSDQLVAESAYLHRTHHKRWTPTLSAEFEPAMQEIEWPQTYALDPTANGIGSLMCYGFAVFRRNSNSVKWDYWLRHVCPYGKTRLPIDRFSWNLIFENF